jgi:hypothetical protein
MRKHRALVVAVGLAALCVAYRRDANEHKLRLYDRFHLPGYDPWVYVAMAENPGFFTVAPWGYRVLSPWLAHLAGLAPVLGPGDEVRGFRRISLAATTLAGALLFLWLRRLGTSEGVSLATVVFFALSEPVDEIIRVPFLAEPTGIVLELLLLLVLEAGGSLPLLWAVLVPGALAKEIFVLLLPGVFFALWPRLGARRALLRTLAAAAPVVATHLLLRQWWAPYPSLSASRALPADQIWLSLYRIAAAAGDWWRPVAATGLPLALLAALLPRAGGFLRRYGYMLALTLVLPFAAGVYVGGASPSPFFFVEDVSRLLLYALPLVIPLALLALDRLRSGAGFAAPAAGAPDEGTAPGRIAQWAAGVVGAAFLAFPFAVLDRYRRVDLRGSRDGPLILAVSRDSPRFAARLERGRAVFYEPVQRRFDRDRSDMRDLERMRWFLRDGWGPMPQYGMGAVRMHAREASLLLPCFSPQDLDVVIALRVKSPQLLTVSVNGRSIGELSPDPSTERSALRIPARALFRGDNVVTLARRGPDTSPVDLVALTVRPTKPRSSP